MKWVFPTMVEPTKKVKKLVGKMVSVQSIVSSNTIFLVVNTFRLKLLIHQVSGDLIYLFLNTVFIIFLNCHLKNE